MRYRDIIAETVFAFTTNKIRTALTTLGIIIGIASVVVMVAIGQGATNAVRHNIEALGSNLLVIAPDSSDGTSTLTLADLQSLKRDLNHISGISGIINMFLDITTRHTSSRGLVVGVESDYAQVRNVGMATGAFFTTQQDEHAAKVAVLGPGVRDALFGVASDPTGQSVRINHVQFEVIGVTSPKGATESSIDNGVYVPFTTARRYLAGAQAELSAINVSAVSEQHITSVDRQTRALLLERHTIRDAGQADFIIRNQSDIAQSLTATTNTLTIMLGSIAGISLLVGGIGIMNMMLTSVTERRREIGLRKAIGATQFDLQTQFLTESVLLTLSGGIIGIALGLAISSLIDLFGLTETAVTWWSVLLAAGITAVVGILFGYYPARRAAKLSPIKALEYQ